MLLPTWGDDTGGRAARWVEDVVDRVRAAWWGRRARGGREARWVEDVVDTRGEGGWPRQGSWRDGSVDGGGSWRGGGFDHGGSI